jgi:hypothetical protein
LIDQQPVGAFASAGCASITDIPTIIGKAEEGKDIMRWTVWTLSVAVTLAASGCGGEAPPNRDPVFPIKGVVTYKGKPVAGADVTFFCQEKDRSAFGRTDKDGSFQLTTFGSNDGAVAGKHTVTVQLIENSEADKPVAPIDSPDYAPPTTQDVTRAARAVRSGLPRKYADQKTSDLTVEVKADGNNPDVKLELKD